MPKTLDTKINSKKSERGIWQRRFWEHLIRDAEDLGNHLEYIYRNPVKHGYVDDPELWPFAHWHRPLKEPIP